MRKLWIAVGLSCALARGAESVKLTLQQAVELALRQSPELALARLDAQKAALGVAVVREPLLPRVYAGSGLAYSNGFPMSIDGASPSIVQAKAVRGLYSRPQSFQVAQARETAHGAAVAAESARDEIAYKTAVLFLDLEQTARAQTASASERASLERVAELVKLRADEGREREIETRRAALQVARARQKEKQLSDQRARLEAQFAAVVGWTAATRVEPAFEERTAPAVPASADELVAQALKSNAELRRLESAIAAKGLEARGFRAMRLPKVDLVAQYGLFAKFNNYTDYFRSFQRNNGQIGLSVSVPLFANAQDEAQAAQADLETARLRTEAQRTRWRVESAAREAWSALDEARANAELARMELELAREQSALSAAQLEAGKLLLKDAELQRAAEQERALGLSEARAGVERACYDLLRQTQALAAVWR